MLSVLIPTYNYNVYPLVNEVHKQLDKSGAEFEIRVYDDASNLHFDTENLLPELSHVVYKKMPQNMGRTALRQKIAQDARYDWLLFMDADVFPKDRFFISKLLKTLEKQKADLYFGGVDVPANPPGKDKVLRWKYGKERESKPLEERKKHPYKSFICGSMLIQKSIFLETIRPLTQLKMYGLDTYFSYLLKKQQRNILHYQNPVIHLGLETNADFIKKTEQAIETYHFLVKKKLLPADYIKLTKIGQNITRIAPYFIRKLKYRLFKPLLLKNLLSEKPSLFLFDLYKLFYYLQLK